jgi:hypothetical protein
MILGTPYIIRKKVYIYIMKKRLTRLVTIAFLLSLVPSNVQTASAAEDYLLSVDMNLID